MGPVNKTWILPSRALILTLETFQTPSTLLHEAAVSHTTRNSYWGHNNRTSPESSSSEVSCIHPQWWSLNTAMHFSKQEIFWTTYILLCEAAMNHPTKNRSWGHAWNKTFPEGTAWRWAVSVQKGQSGARRVQLLHFTLMK